ncbi:hypothetical protein ACLOJK_000278 [Asimina triloba]
MEGEGDYLADGEWQRAPESAEETTTMATGTEREELALGRRGHRRDAEETTMMATGTEREELAPDVARVGRGTERENPWQPTKPNPRLSVHRVHRAALCRDEVRE